MPRCMKIGFFLLFMALAWVTLAAPYRFLLSLAPDRAAGPYDLAQYTVSTKVYPYIEPSTGLAYVEFFLDKTSLTEPFCTEKLPPFDCMGTAADGTAKPLDLAALSPGTHTLTAKLTLTTGAVQVLAAKIEIPGAAPGTGATPSPAPTPVATATPSPKPTVTPAPRGAVKWHPGHYLNAYWGTALAYHIGKAKATPALKGINVIHQWRDLEPSKGVYNFASIEAELKAAQAAGVRLMIQVNDRTFWANRPDCVPEYLKTDPIYQGGQSKVGVKCTALRHVPAVQDRLIALFQALGKRFDPEPYFEAVMLEEDSMEKTGTNMAGYSDRAYIDQSKRGMSALAQAFPHTVVFKFLNWGPGIPELFAHAQALGLGVGAPDLDPKSKTWSYPQPLQSYAGKIPLEMSVQDPRSTQTFTQSTVQQVFDYGTAAPPKGLGLNYIVWDQMEVPAISWAKTVLPYLIQRQGFTQTACPEALVKRGGCAL